MTNDLLYRTFINNIGQYLNEPKRRWENETKENRNLQIVKERKETYVREGEYTSHQPGVKFCSIAHQPK
jgi:hypothetical protein